MPKRNYLETQLQMACVRWFAFEFPKQKGCLFMVNNESMSAQEMAKNKKMGLTPGVSDLIYLSPSGQMVCLELKWGKGRQSKSQKAWEERIKKHNAEYHIIRDVQKFINVIRKHQL